VSSYCTTELKEAIQARRAAEEGTGVREGPSGRYDLVGVVTHMGRTADGGHYLGWTKKGGSRARTVALTT
jgi:ubiquitin C-terminal hydrolase